MNASLACWWTVRFSGFFHSAPERRFDSRHAPRHRGGARRIARRRSYPTRLFTLPTERAVAPQNGSGTDHGAAGLAFLIGNQAAGKMIGEFPGLSKLDENENLVNTSDFRAMYCSLLEQWFQTDAGVAIPESASFARPQLIKI